MPTDPDKAANERDAAIYAEIPVEADEFSTDEQLIDLDADGWEEFAEQPSPRAG